jgi:hypothetical protein
MLAVPRAAVQTTMLGLVAEKLHVWQDSRVDFEILPILVGSWPHEIERMPQDSRTISTSFTGITPEDPRSSQPCRVLGYLRYLSRHMVYL